MANKAAMDHINSLIGKDDLRKVASKKLKSENLELVEYKFTPLDGAGMMGTHAKLNTIVKLKGETKEELRFFVKLFPHLEMSAEYATKSNVFQTEVNMYRLFQKVQHKYMPSLQEVLPECHYIKDGLLLVMDDLQSLGYEQIGRCVEDPEVVFELLKSLATFHAATVVYESKMGEGYSVWNDYKCELKENFFNENIETSLQAVNSCVNAVLKSFELFNLSIEDLEAKLRSQYRKIFGFVKPQDKIRSVICHGDLWPSNILASPSNKCKFVDFQFPRYASPTCELLSVIYLTTNRSFRSKYLRSATETYYKALVKTLNDFGLNGSQIYPLDAFNRSCEEMKTFGIMAAAYYFPVILLESEDLQVIMEDRGVSEQVFFVNKGVAYDYVTKNKDEYFGRLKESVLDLKDLLQSR